MATRILPVLPGVPLQGFDVELSGTSYRVELAWNERDAAWSLILLARDGVLLAGGRAVVIGAPLVGRSRDSRLPPGLLFAIDTSGQDREPALEDLGDRVVLAYVEPDA